MAVSGLGTGAGFRRPAQPNHPLHRVGRVATLLDLVRAEDALELRIVVDVELGQPGEISERARQPNQPETGSVR